MTDLDMGGTNLVVPGYETSSFRPEAHLSFDLGYDFMQEFSGDSTELVRFNIQSESAVTPTFLISPRDEVFNSGHLSSLFAFVLFWGVIFLAVFHFMKPSSLKEAATSVEAHSDVLTIGPQLADTAPTPASLHEQTNSAISGNSAARVG